MRQETNLLEAKHRISHAKATSVEISDIKQMVEMKLMEVLSIEEEKKKVIELLGMK